MKISILEYREQGMQVLPALSSAKQAAVRRGELEKYYTAKITDDQFRYHMDYAKSKDDVGYCILAGEISMVIVVDIDGADPATRKRRMQEWLKKYPTGWIVKTRNHGYHLYYRYNPNIKTDIKKSFPDIDIFSDKRVLMIPPTDGYTQMEASYLGELPDDLTAPKFSEVPSDVMNGLYPSLTRDNAKLLDTLIHGPGKVGGRNDNIHDAAWPLLRAFPKLSRADFIEAMMQTYAQSEGKPEIEVTLRTLNSIYDKFEKTPSGDEFTIDKELDFNFIANNVPEFTEPLIKKWMPGKAVVLMVAPPESYKSMVAADLAISIAHGKGEFLGEKLNRGPVPTMYLNFEDDEELIHERLYAIIKSKKIDAAEIYVPTETSFALIKDYNFLPNLERYIVERNIQFCVIDPLFDINNTEGEHMIDVATFIKDLGLLAKSIDCTFLLVHHTSKPANNGTKGKKGKPEYDRSSIYGSTFLNGKSKGAIMINEVGDDATIRRITASGKAFRGRHEVEVQFNIANTTGKEILLGIEPVYEMNILDETVVQEQEKFKRETQEARILHHVKNNPGCTGTEIAESIKENGINKNTIKRRFLTPMIDEGKLRNGSANKHPKYYLGDGYE